ncbi:MAG: hypothetical protein WCJ29_04650 [bacterium]
MNMKLPKNELIDKLRALELPPEDFAIFGSGPMWAHGLHEMHDLDVLARGEAWKKAKANGTLQKAIVSGEKVDFADGLIEVFDTWGPGEWNVDELIDTAEEFDGIKFVKLANVLKWKRLMGREKDADHVKLIEQYMHN